MSVLLRPGAEVGPERLRPVDLRRLAGVVLAARSFVNTGADWKDLTVVAELLDALAAAQVQADAARPAAGGGGR